MEIDEATIVKQSDVMNRALELYQQRENVHKGLWRQDGLDGLLDVATHAKNKAMRLQNFHRSLIGIHPPEMRTIVLDEALDAALDLINYGCFCARLIQEARDGG